MACSCCQKEEVYAKNLCSACYNRLRRTGTLEYKVKGKSPAQCTADGCSEPHVAKGFCEKHYKRLRRKGSSDRSVFAYSNRQKHKLYGVWTTMRRCAQGRCEEWNDFWVFVNDVPPKPEGNYTTRRYETSKPWSSDNFYWKELMPHNADGNDRIRKWRKYNPLASKEHSLKQSYGITLADYMEMYDTQKGKCKICGIKGESFSAEAGRTETLVVDHCHDKKRVRGLLCASCNMGLGKFKDNAQLLENAVKYLRENIS